MPSSAGLVQTERPPSVALTCAQEREPIMTHRAIVAGVIAFVVGVASVATISNEALARGGRGGARHVGGYHGGAHHVYRGAPVRRGVAVGVGAAAAGAAAGAYYYGQRQQCGYYPYPACY